MKRAAVVLLGLFVCSTPTLTAQDIRYAASAVRMRADAAANSRVVVQVPQGARLEVRACAVEWCWVQYGKRTGYVAERYLIAPRARIAESGRRTYVNAKGARVAAPLFSQQGPPRGATARCRDGTYSFSQSRSGTCSGHGGVSKWL
jgi:uncharacterized protein YraI